MFTPPDSTPSKGATVDDVKPLVARVVIWFLVALSILANTVRFAAKVSKRRLDLTNISVDSWLVVVSTILSILQSLLFDFAIANGIGQPIQHDAQNKMENALQYLYVSELLYVLSLCFAKLAAVTLIYIITPKKIYRHVATGIGVFIGIWTITGFLSVAFQCDLPTPWDDVGRRCFKRRSFWDSYEAFNMLIDLLLIIAPVLIVYRTQSAPSQKLKLSLPFVVRISAFAPCITKMVFWSTSQSQQSPSPHFWKIQVSNAVIQCLEIVLVCSISIKQFLDAGLLESINLARHGNVNVMGLEGACTSPRRLERCSSDHQSYIPLREGSTHSTHSQKLDFHIARTDVTVQRGRSTGDELVIGGEQIEMRRDITVEEAPWRVDV